LNELPGKQKASCPSKVKEFLLEKSIHRKLHQLNTADPTVVRLDNCPTLITGVPFTESKKRKVLLYKLVIFEAQLKSLIFKLLANLNA
jgi:hypothetical protein